MQRSEDSEVDLENAENLSNSMGQQSGKKLHNEEHHNLYSWPSIIRMVKSRG
jgi:hypothetical protein